MQVIPGANKTETLAGTSHLMAHISRVSFHLPKRALGGVERSVRRSLLFPTSSPIQANCSSRTHPDSHLVPLPNTEINSCQFNKVKGGRDVFDRAREKILNNIHNVKVLLTPVLQSCCYILD